MEEGGFWSLSLHGVCMSGDYPFPFFLDTFCVIYPVFHMDGSTITQAGGVLAKIGHIVRMSGRGGFL